jgi:hypothetical protein
MSNLKNASLILKTTDLFDSSPIVTLVYGYYSTTTKFIVTTSNGLVQANSFIPNVSVVTPSDDLDVNGYGYLTLTTAVANATDYHSTHSMASTDNILYMTSPTTTQSCSMKKRQNVLTLSAVNTDVEIGQLVTGKNIPDNTQIVSGSGTTWVLSNSIPSKTTTTVSFYTIPVGVSIGDGVSGTGYADGASITNGPFSSIQYGLYYTTNTIQTVTGAMLHFYTTFQQPIYDNSLTDATYFEYNGTSNKFRTSMTWNSINLRTLLGDMYSDYDLFNLCLISIDTAVPQGSISTDANNLNVIVKVGGLPFINQTYDVGGGHNRRDATICGFRFNASTPSSTLYYGNNIATFGKNQELLNLTIYYERIVDGIDPSITGILPPKTPAVTSPFPHCVFNFDIVGVEKYSKNASRL